MRDGKQFVLALIPLSGLGLLACLNDHTADGESTATDPDCTPPERLVDVHFAYDTASQLETGSCELTTFEPSGQDTAVVSTSCGFPLELDGVNLPAMDLHVGDMIALETLVDDPLTAALGCAENGWLTIDDLQGRAQFLALSVADAAPRLSLGDLGEIEFREELSDGCSGLQISAGGDEAIAFPGTSTEIELAGVHWLVQLGPFNSAVQSMGCPPERYSMVMFRLPG